MTTLAFGMVIWKAPITLVYNMTNLKKPKHDPPKSYTDYLKDEFDKGLMSGTEYEVHLTKFKYAKINYGKYYGK